MVGCLRFDIRGEWAGRPRTLAANVLESRVGGYAGEDLNGWAATGVWLAGVRSWSSLCSPRCLD